MTIANRKHDLVAVQVYDRRVEELPPVGLMKIRDAATGHEQLSLIHICRRGTREDRDMWNKQFKMPFCCFVRS